MKFLLIAFCTCHLVFAAELTFSQKLRPYAEKFIGEEWTQKIFGKGDLIVMPTLPTVDSDAKSTAIYDNQRKDNQISSVNAKKYDLLYLGELYDVVYDSMLTPNNSEYAKWVNVMDQGATREGVYRAIVLDQNYLTLENRSSRLTARSIAFVKEFMNKYLGKKVTDASIEKINFFSVKRLIVEKSLDLMDSFPGKNDDIYNWYSLLSSDLAKKSSWKNKVRQFIDPLQHKRWAKAVPIQHMKSELIIKLHMAMNKFNS